MFFFPLNIVEALLVFLNSLLGSLNAREKLRTRTVRTVSMPLTNARARNALPAPGYVSQPELEADQGVREFCSIIRVWHFDGFHVETWLDQ